MSQARQTILKIILRVAIYARLSDEDKHKSNYSDLSESIKNQIALATKYAQERDWVIVGIYCDDDWSGLDRDRPEFNRLLRDCEEGKIDIVLCKDMSRFTRDKIITEEYLETKFLEWNIRFIGLIDGSDTADKANKKSREINALVNQWYAEDISNKVRAAFKTKQEQGLFIGSYPTYGYIKSETIKGKLEIDPEAAQIVKKIFTLYLAGYGTLSIAKILNVEGIPNPATYKESKNGTYKNAFKKNDHGLWSKTSVKRILRNKAYIGYMVQRKNEKLHFKTKKRKNLPKEAWIVVKDTHESIIDRDKFFKVQELLDLKIRSTGKGTSHLFAGKVFCKDCGDIMVKSSRGKYKYLTCSLFRTDPTRCSRHSIRLDFLTAEVDQRIRELLAETVKDKDKILQQLIKNDDFGSSVRILNSKVEGINRRIKEVHNALKTLYLDKNVGKIDTFIFNNLIREFIGEKNQLEKQLEKTTNELNAVIDQANRPQYWSIVFDKCAKFPGLTRQMVNELISRIEIGEKEDGPREIVIHYSFKRVVSKNSLPM